MAWSLGRHFLEQKTGGAIHFHFHPVMLTLAGKLRRPVGANDVEHRRPGSKRIGLGPPWDPIGTRSAVPGGRRRWGRGSGPGPDDANGESDGGSALEEEYL